MAEKMNGTIVGAGNFTKYVLQRLTGIYDRSKISGVKDLSDQIGNIWLVDVNENALRETGDEFKVPVEHRVRDLGQVTDTPDFAIIATSADLHYEPAKHFLEANVPVFVSKPLDADYQKALDLIRIAEETGTPNATGSQMLLHPAFVAAVDYLAENNVKIKQVMINWAKERGPREHVIKGVTVEEGPHPFGILATLIPKAPNIVYAVARPGEIIIAPGKWDTHPTKPKFIGREDYHEEEHIVAEIDMASTALVEYDDATAVVWNDFEAPKKERTINIVGELPIGERFQRSVSITVDLTDVQPQYEGDAPYTKEGILVVKGCLDKSKRDRSGMGEVVIHEKFSQADTLGEQMGNFLEWAKTGEKTAGMSSFNDNNTTDRISEKLVDLVLKSMGEKRRVNHL